MRIITILSALFLVMACISNSSQPNGLWYSAEADSFLLFEDAKAYYFKKVCLEPEIWHQSLEVNEFISENIELVACRNNPNKHHYLNINIETEDNESIISSQDSCFQKLFEGKASLKFYKEGHRSLLMSQSNYSHIIISLPGEVKKEIVIPKSELASFNVEFKRTSRQILSIEEQFLLFIKTQNVESFDKRKNVPIAPIKMELFQNDELIGESYYTNPRCQFKEMGKMINAKMNDNILNK